MWWVMSSKMERERNKTTQKQKHEADCQKGLNNVSNVRFAVTCIIRSPDTFLGVLMQQY